MNKISKNLLAGATALTLCIGTLAGVAPAFAATFIDDTDDGTGGDLNILEGAVADSELVQITVRDILSISTGNTGLVASIDKDAVTTPLAGTYTVTPGTMGEDPANPVIPSTTPTEGYSSQIVKSNNASGYFMSIMMCNNTAGTNYPTAVAGCRATSALERGTGTVTIPMTTDNSPTLTGTTGATVGGFWGYRANSVIAGDTALTASPSGNWQAVPAFDDNTPYGDTLVNSTAPGAAAVNVNFGVVTNANLPSGVYNNYVIYTAVANP